MWYHKLKYVQQSGGALYKDVRPAWSCHAQVLSQNRGDNLYHT